MRKKIRFLTEQELWLYAYLLFDVIFFVQQLHLLSSKQHIRDQCLFLCSGFVS